mmetsp:Transcript_15510/g.26685  ORF Transcript_15510/g.26685 Transcript_15510/m.26685 type:complete len:118 (-) Transcript_15510:11-364(-)
MVTSAATSLSWILAFRAVRNFRSNSGRNFSGTDFSEKQKTCNKYAAVTNNVLKIAVAALSNTCGSEVPPNACCNNIDTGPRLRIAGQMEMVRLRTSFAQSPRIFRKDRHTRADCDES